MATAPALHASDDDGVASPAVTSRASDYFRPSAADPRVLERTPYAIEHGFDRGYHEQFGRPRPSPEVLDLLENASDAPFSRQLFPPGEMPAGVTAATLLNGNVLVIEGSAATVVNTNDGYAFNHLQGGVETVINTAWQQLGDNFDFITVFTTFSDRTLAAYYRPLQNNVSGLGECDLDNGDWFGCAIPAPIPGSPLQGFVFMNGLSYWQEWDYYVDGQVHGFDEFDSHVYSTLGQEIGHRWLVGFRFVDPRNGNMSNKLLGRDASHWAAYVDTGASVLDGWKWEDLENGTFRVVEANARFSTLDLYGMGVLSAGDTEPFFFIDNAQYKPTFFTSGVVPSDAVAQMPDPAFLDSNYGVFIEATGERVDLSIRDVVAAEGVRCPDPDHTQRSFRQLFVLLTQPGQSASSTGAQAAVQSLETIRETWERWWSENTRKALRICTDIGEVCGQPTARLARGSLNDEGLLEAGDSVTLNVRSRALDIDMLNGRLEVSLVGSGRDHATLGAETIAIGDMEPDVAYDMDIPLSLSADFPCREELAVRVALVSDNAATVTEDYRLRPAGTTVYFQDFNADESGFVGEGSFVRENIQTSCSMTPDSPVRDAGIGGFALVTGADTPLDGSARAESPEIDLEGHRDVELSYNYWVSGAASMTVKAVNENGDTVEVARHAAREGELGATGWAYARANLYELFGGSPTSVKLLFEAEGEGGEVGVDDIALVSFDGTECTIAPPLDDSDVGNCGCESTGRGQPAGVALLAGLLLIGIRRRRL